MYQAAKPSTWYTRLFDYPKVMNAFLIDIDEKPPLEVEPKDGQKFTIEELQSYIGSDKLKFLTTHEGGTIVIDAYEGCQYTNVRASLLYKYGYKHQIKGKALFCKSTMINEHH